MLKRSCVCSKRNQVSEYNNNGSFQSNQWELGHPNIYESTGKDKDVVKAF